MEMATVCHQALQSSECFVVHLMHLFRQISSAIFTRNFRMRT